MSRNALSMRGFLILTAMLAPGAALAAEPAAPKCYVKKATWYETLIASREALTAAEAAGEPKAGPGGFQPFRAVIPYRGGAQRIKMNVAGMKTLYLGAYSSGRLEAHLAEARLIHRDGPPVLLELTKPLLAGMTGKKSVAAVRNRRTKQISSYRIQNTEMEIALNGEYTRLEAVVRISRGTGGDKAVFWAAARPSLEACRHVLTARDAIWAAVGRDFTTSAAKDQLAAEKRFWTQDWPAGDLSPVARQYAAAARSQQGAAQKLAPTAKSVPAFQKVRALYLLGERAEQIAALVREVNLEAMRRAIRDLSETFPKEYPHGAKYLEQLGTWEKALPDILAGLGKGDAAALKRGEALVAFQRKALLSNPLMNFDKLLLVRRGLSNLGLVNNWLSNSSVRKNGYDNEIAVLSPVRPDGELTTLYKPEAGRFVGDVDLEFDADKLLFSMPGEKHWHVWQTDADGGNLTQLTPEVPDVDAYDACYLPDGKVIFTSTANMQGVPCIGGGGHVANLALLDPKTKDVRMLAFEQDHDWCPAVMNDGRVMYLRWEYTDTPHYYTRLIFAMNPDGTNQRAWYGSNSYWPNATFFARPIPGHDTMFVGIVGGHHDVQRMGELIVFDTARGTHEADGVVQRIPGHGEKVQPIIKDGLVGGSWPHFLHPYPLGDPRDPRGAGKYFLVTRRMSRDRGAPWGVFLVDVFDNMVLIKSQPGYALFEPVPFRKTPRPPTIPDKVNLRRKDALVMVQDVYAGPGLAGIPRGKVKKLRVFTYTFGYRGMGGHNCFGVESGWDAKRILGTVPVEKDGSAFFRVPANTPISLQPLDENNAALQLMRSWLVAMPGETLACVGCHEDPHDATAEFQATATRRGPSAIQPWRGPARGMGFPREVQPVLDKYCAGCHNGKKENLPNFADTSKGWRGYYKSYHALARYIRRPGPESDYALLHPMEYHASTSEVVQKLLKGHHGVRLDEEAWDRLHTWIDLNVPFNATWGEFRGGRLGTVADRFREFQKLYANIDCDQEALPPVPTDKPKPVLPKPQAVVRVDAPEVPGWPFSAAEARKRQAAAAASVSASRPAGRLGVTGPTQDQPPAQDALETLTIPLGMTPERRHHITCKPIPPKAVALKLTLIPAGEFVMGSPAGHADERRLTRVKIDKPFWMGTFEVTNAQYSVFDPTHDSRFIDMELKDQEHPGYPADGPDQPVIRINWQEAVRFCEWLGKKTGMQFSLPTEAQWEWACRAGTSTPLWYGETGADFAAFANLADVQTKKFALERFRPRIAANPAPEHAFIPKVEAVDDKHQIAAPVGSYKPNAWGLYDMHGNVWEWTRSSYRPYPYWDADGRNDGSVRARKVARGGSWFDRPKRARSSFRLSYEPYQKVHNVGFRVVAEAK